MDSITTHSTHLPTPLNSCYTIHRSLDISLDNQRPVIEFVNVIISIHSSWFELFSSYIVRRFQTTLKYIWKSKVFLSDMLQTLAYLGMLWPLEKQCNFFFIECLSLCQHSERFLNFILRYWSSKILSFHWLRAFWAKPFNSTS